jgi:hypothetical protein
MILLKIKILSPTDGITGIIVLHNIGKILRLSLVQKLSGYFNSVPTSYGCEQWKISKIHLLRVTKVTNIYKCMILNSLLLT